MRFNITHTIVNSVHVPVPMVRHRGTRRLAAREITKM